jgi:NAD+ kinase
VHRIGLVVHPSRDIGIPLAALEEWTERRGIEIVQLPTGDPERIVAPFGEVSACDLVVAIGGDGTVLTALRGAASSSTPVLGVACGSLGALSAVTVTELEAALDSFEAGAWSPRDVPALEVAVDSEEVAWAINDFSLVRRAGQLVVDVSVDGELYARLAGDGVVVATPLGSAAYSMAAGGPVLVNGAGAFVVTPLVMHGGSAPPLVVREGLEVTLDAHPGYSGFAIEIDGHEHEIEGTTFTLTLADGKATLVAIGDPGLGLTALRRRGQITDSPRVIARDQRGSNSSTRLPDGSSTRI